MSIEALTDEEIAETHIWHLDRKEKDALEHIRQYAEARKKGFDSMGAHVAQLSDLLTDIGNFLDIELEWHTHCLETKRIKR